MPVDVVAHAEALCRDSAHKGDEVVMTLTDYSQEAQVDRQLLEVLKRSYRRVYLWCQGSGDYEYYTSIANLNEVKMIPPGLRAYDDLLNDRSVSLDYVGTRLHGGIRALQHKRRTLIIGVDHRALEKGRDFNLPVLKRYVPAAELEQAVNLNFPCVIQIPVDKIGAGRNSLGRRRSLIVSERC